MSEDTELFTEVKDFMREVIDAESDNRQRGVKALRFRDGEQWPDDLYRSREVDQRLSMTINHTDTFVTRVENGLKQQRPRIKAHPVGDGADIEKAATVNGLMRHIENRSQASYAYDCAASSALNVGWGYARVIPEWTNERSFVQELRIAAIRNPFTVYKDPASILPDASDAMRFVITEKMSRAKYKMLYPKALNCDWGDYGTGDDLATGQLGENRESIVLAEYFRIVERPERLFKMLDGTTRFESDFAPGVLKVALAMPEAYGFALENGQAVERKSFKRQVEWHRFNGRMRVASQDLPGRHIPIAMCEGNVLDINGKVRRKGMIENMIEPAQLVNYSETAVAEKIFLAPKAPWVAGLGQTEGRPEWDDANQRNYSVLKYQPIFGPEGQPIPPPQRGQPSQMEAGLQQMLENSKSNLMAIAGMPHEPGADSQGEVVSGVAIQQRRKLADDTHYQYYDNETKFISFIGRICFDYIPYYYDTERQQRIIGADGVPTIITLNEKQPDGTVKNDMTIVNYDVVMDTGPGYDTKREEGAAGMTQLLGTPMGEPMVKTAADIVMRSYDFPYAEEIADRMMPQSPQGMSKVLQELPKQAQNIIKAMQGQLTQLQQELADAQMDLKHGLTKSLHQDATKLSIETMKDKRAEKDTATDAGVKLEDTHTRAQTSISVAEIREAGGLLNTHVEAAHNRVAAQDALQAAQRVEG